MIVSVWVYVTCALIVVFSLGVFVGALVGSPGSRGHGGTVDLSRSAARGELDLDWADPRDEPERRPSFGV